jgi:general secretion pathway protein G
MSGERVEARRGDAETRRRGERKEFIAPLRERLSTLSFSASRERGFTLLELMIVISIIVILALIVLPQYNKTVLAAREAVLRDNLFQMRKMIDQYAADKGKLPASLDELVTAGYLHDIPEDPITGEKDWVPVPGEDPNTEGESGIVNVCSASSDQASDGTVYSDCAQW